MENFKWYNHRNAQKFQTNNTSCWFQMLPLLYENEIFYSQRFQARSSNSTLTGVCHLLQTHTCYGKVGHIPHCCKTQGHKVVSFAGERSTEARAKEEPIEQTLGQQNHPKWGAQHIPNSHSQTAERSHTGKLSPAPDCHQLMDWQTGSIHIPTLN